MLNPDGVIIGNHRTGMCGNDLNRKFPAPLETVQPTVFAIKALVADLVHKKNAKIFTYLDFHGHSLRKNVFVYGGEFPVYDPRYDRIRILPKIMSHKTDMFRFFSCIFRIHSSKTTTARAIFFSEYGIDQCYTLEASYASWFTQDRETLNFDPSSFRKMGMIVVESLYEYHTMLKEEDGFKKLKLLEKKEEKKAEKKEKDRKSVV